MSAEVKDNVDYRLLNRMSDLVICSHCLRSGRVTPVPQIFSSHRSPTNLCPPCRARLTPASTRAAMGKLLKFPR